MSLISDAKFVVERHLGNKVYGEIFPYTKHTADVAKILEEVMDHFVVDPSSELYVTLIASAWLHDILEETGLSYNDLKKHFGLRIAECVFAVTPDIGRNRKERNKNLIKNLEQNGFDSFAVKLADRLANMSFGYRTGNFGMLKMYVEENKKLFEAVEALVIKMQPDDLCIVKSGILTQLMDKLKVFSNEIK